MAKAREKPKPKPKPKLKPKARVKEPPPSKGRSTPARSKPGASKATGMSDPAALGRRETWQGAIDRLVGREFTSMDEALTELVGEVFRTVGGEANRDEREFVTDLLATDPEFMRDLGRMLRIKRQPG